jgi:hypothetical protein
MSKRKREESVEKNGISQMVKYKYKGKQLIVQELVTTLRQRVQNAKEAYSKDVDNEVMEKRCKTLRAKLMKETKTINSTPFVTSLPTRRFTKHTSPGI